MCVGGEGGGGSYADLQAGVGFVNNHFILRACLYRKCIWPGRPINVINTGISSVIITV